MNLGWIELVFFYGFAIGFAVWQYWKTDRELKRTRAKRLEEEAKAARAAPTQTAGKVAASADTPGAPEDASASGSRHPIGQHELHDR
ncbi:MAG: hypothetical protein AAF494_11150 [Pseudomonadota bacterium]